MIDKTETNYFLLDIIEVDVDKEDEKEEEEEEPELEGRINVDKDDFMTTTTLRPTEQPETVDKCHLPYYPATDPDLENAWRFGIFLNIISGKIFK